MASKSSHIRSNSFPRESHPTILRVEEILNQIKSSQLSSSSSESICVNLCRLTELYNSMDDLFNLPSTIQSLSRQAEDFLDASLRILDICGITREIVSQFKENVRDLQSSLRRRKEDNYTCFRKKMKKDAKRSISALKQIDLSLNDEHICSVIREVNAATTAVFHSVLIFLSADQSKQSKWSLVSRLGHKEDEQESRNEIEIVDSALKKLCRNDQSENKKIQNKVEILESAIDGVESELEGLYRCLIRSRTSLLNIISC